MKSENPENSISLNRVELFKYHSFLSLSRTISFPYKEWVGETKNDEVIIIRYKEGEISIGTGWNEINAKNNIESIASSKNTSGLTIHDNGLGIERINEQLKLEWVLPVGYVDE